MSDMNDYYRLNIPDGEVKRVLDSDNKVLWRRAIEKSTNEDNFEGTRNTALKALSRFGNCIQASTPTPDAPVDIMCNNGAIKYGWHDIITTSQLSGYGTYVSHYPGFCETGRKDYRCSPVCIRGYAGHQYAPVEEYGRNGRGTAEDLGPVL